MVNGVETENTLTPQQEQHNPVKLMTLDTSTPDEAPPSSRMPQEPRREPYVKPSRSAARPMLLDEISGKIVFHPYPRCPHLRSIF